ncbi:MAG: ABC transporter ATP-binding protein [Clostridia bacterium]|nr:ABC transporter ATP-binding protein [Clostridia bacterium]
MIAFRGVSKTYGKSGTLAVDHLDLQVETGELFGFIGPNGAGKTTSIKMLTGILDPSEGETFIDGISMQRNPMEAKRLIGFVPDGADLFDRLTGMEYLNFMADIFNVSATDRKNRMEKYLTLFELTDAVGSQIRSYSKGMRQKLATIGALIHDPSVWVLDEPMMGLDPRASFLLKEEMRNQCAQGKTVFFSTHVLEVAEKLCTRIALINHGKLAAQGTLEELKAEEHASSLEEIFLELTETPEEAQG